MPGQYMPTHISNTQKLQKVRVSDLERIGTNSEVEAMTKMIVRRLEGVMRR